MLDKREDDLKPHTKFRVSRFFKESCEWYFLTREGSQSENDENIKSNPRTERPKATSTESGDYQEPVSTAVGTKRPKLEGNS
jgi:hypothetical protein